MFVSSIDHHMEGLREVGGDTVIQYASLMVEQ